MILTAQKCSTGGYGGGGGGWCVGVIANFWEEPGVGLLKLFLSSFPLLVFYQGNLDEAKKWREEREQEKETCELN